MNKARQLGSVDRFEGEFAILEVEGKEQRRPRKSLATDVKEGDVVNLATGEKDVAATEQLLQEVREARKRANQGKPPSSGNFDL